MKNLFEKQLNTNNVVTEETLNKLKIKTYKNGDEIKVGDKVLYAFLTDVSADSITPIEKDAEPHEIQLELITLNENQFGIYTYDEQFQGIRNEVPVIRLK